MTKNKSDKIKINVYSLCVMFAENVEISMLIYKNQGL